MMQKQDRIIKKFETGTKFKEGSLLSGEMTRQSVMYRAWRKRPWNIGGPREEEGRQAGVFRAREAMVWQLKKILSDRETTRSLKLALDQEKELEREWERFDYCYFGDGWTWLDSSSSKEIVGVRLDEYSEFEAALNDVDPCWEDEDELEELIWVNEEYLAMEEGPSENRGWASANRYWLARHGHLHADGVFAPLEPEGQETSLEDELDTLVNVSDEEIKAEIGNWRRAEGVLE
jgi:hypothetical protein